MPLTKPTVGGSTDIWGTILNDALDYLDGLISTNTTDIAARLPLAGGTMTGRLTAKTESMARVDVATTSGDTTFDLSAGNFFTVAPTGISNWIFSNIPAGTIATAWIVKVTNPGAFAFTFAASIKWPSATVPTFTAAGVDYILFITDDAGATIRATMLMKDSR